jgi:hypothetical protein
MRSASASIIGGAAASTSTPAWRARIRRCVDTGVVGAVDERGLRGAPPTGVPPAGDAGDAAHADASHAPCSARVEHESTAGASCGRGCRRGFEKLSGRRAAIRAQKRHAVTL